MNNVHGPDAISPTAGARFLVVVAVLVAMCLTVLTNHRVPPEIGPDTTVITGPLNADGTVNYLAYLNEQKSKGIAPKK